MCFVGVGKMMRGAARPRLRSKTQRGDQRSENARRRCGPKLITVFSPAEQQSWIYLSTKREDLYPGMGARSNGIMRGVHTHSHKQEGPEYNLLGRDSCC